MVGRLCSIKLSLSSRYLPIPTQAQPHSLAARSLIEHSFVITQPHAIHPGRPSSGSTHDEPPLWSHANCRRSLGNIRLLLPLSSQEIDSSRSHPIFDIGGTRSCAGRTGSAWNGGRFILPPLFLAGLGKTTMLLHLLPHSQLRDPPFAPKADAHRLSSNGAVLLSIWESKLKKRFALSRVLQRKTHTHNAKSRQKCYRLLLNFAAKTTVDNATLR